MSNWLEFKDTSNLFKSAYVKGFVDISGGDFIARNGNLYIHGDASLNNNVFIKNKLIVGTTTDSDYHLDISGNAKISNSLVINGDASLNNHLFVNNDASFNNSLSVTNDINSNVIKNSSIFQF